MWFSRGIRETMTWGGGAFHAKLLLVVLLIGTFGYLQVLQKKAARDPSSSAMTSSRRSRHYCWCSASV